MKPLVWQLKLRCIAKVLQCAAVSCGELQCVVASTCTSYVGPVYEAIDLTNLARMYCSASQCVAVCCSVLQCVAVCCSVLQLQRVALCCSELHP